MTLSALLAALARYWLLLVASVLAGLLAATAFVVYSPRTYASTASVYVTAVAPSEDPVSAAAPLQDAYQGTLLAQEKIKSYPDLVVSDRVLLPVARQFELGDSTAELADRVSVGTSTESTVLRVTAEDREPERAAELANAITSEFIVVVGLLERPEASGQPAQVSIEVVDEARANDNPVSPRRNLTLAVGLVLGLLLGITAAVVRATVTDLSSGAQHRSDRRRPAPAPAADLDADLGRPDDGEKGLQPPSVVRVDAPRV